MKILVTDADGTITFGEHTVSKEVVESLKNFKDESTDNITVLATGRNINPAKYILDTNNIKFDYYILSNGAIIANSDFELLYTKPFDFCVADICEVFGDHYRIDTIHDHYFTPKYRESTNFPVDKLNIIECQSEILEDIYVVSSRLYDKSEMDRVVEELYDRRLQLIQNNMDIDVQPLGVDKFDAIKRLIEIEGFKNYELFTIGDSFNDVQMIRNCENGASFTYAKEEIQKHAKFIVKDFPEYISKYVLN